MQRCEVLQMLLDLFPQPSYLEIGVDIGNTFSRVQAARKVAVDVRFAFDWQAAAADPVNAHASFHEVSSDSYFGRHRQGETFDLIFIDGLHSYEQTLADLLNAWASLKPGGLIVVDDVLPNSYFSSLPDLEASRRLWAAAGHPDGSWMGDVYRLVFFVETFMQAFSFATVQENHGQMVLWQQPRIDAPRRTVRETCVKEYADTWLERETFGIAPLSSIVARITEWRANL